MANSTGEGKGLSAEQCFTCEGENGLPATHMVKICAACADDDCAPMPDFLLPEQRDLTPEEQQALRRVYAKLYKPTDSALRLKLEKLVAKGKVGWMDSTDFEDELGHALGGNKVYPDKEDCEKEHQCITIPDEYHPCTAKRVIVFDADELPTLLTEDSSKGDRGGKKDE